GAGTPCPVFPSAAPFIPPPPAGEGRWGRNGAPVAARAVLSGALWPPLAIVEPNAPHEQVCEPRSEARAPCDGGFARPHHPDAAPPGAPQADHVRPGRLEPDLRPLLPARFPGRRVMTAPLRSAVGG